VKDAPYRVSKGECFVLLLRNLNPNSGSLGKWEPLSRSGWKVVFLGRHDAAEGMRYVGSQLFPRPAYPDGSLLDDEDYERWLLTNHFHVERTEITNRHEMAWGEYIQGWVPGMDEFRTGKSSPAITWRVYESRFAKDAQFLFPVAG